MSPKRRDGSRCGWARTELSIPYHDREWGVPCRDDRLLFEHLVLDCAQAGLSWEIMLRKREGYRRAFAGFDPERVARFNRRSVERLLADSGIVRNRQKIESAIGNARAFLDVREEAGSFARHLWGFVDGEPVQNRWRSIGQIPAKTPLAETVSKDLKGRGFTFVGPTIVYAFLQATGVVNDHLVGCFRHAECARLGRSRRGLSSGGSSSP
ncbi:MAG: DNA-3-methyladenine glycosylase I [Gemmatimonadota bacterium]